MSLYAAYGTSYDPSAENLTLSTKTADLAPEMDHTYELGVKAIDPERRLALTARCSTPRCRTPASPIR